MATLEEFIIRAKEKGLNRDQIKLAISERRNTIGAFDDDVKQEPTTFLGKTVDFLKSAVSAPAALPIMLTKEEPTTPTTFAGKATEMVKSVARRPFGGELINVQGVAEAPTVQEAYYEAMPRQERQAAQVKSAKSAAIENILKENPEAFSGTGFNPFDPTSVLPYIAPPELTSKIRGKTADVALEFAPFEPSSFASEAVPFAMQGMLPVVRRGAAKVIPLKRYETAEKGIEEAARKVAGAEVGEDVGTKLKGIYTERVGKPLAELTTPEVPYVKKSEAEMLKGRFEPAAKKIYPEYTGLEIAGQKIKEGNFTKYRNLYDSAEKAWEPINSKLNNKNVKLLNAREEIGGILSEQGDIPLLETLPETIKKAAIESGNAEQYARNYIKTFSPESITDVRHIDPRFNLLNKANDIVSNPEVPYKQVHGFLGELGSKIDWSGKGDATNRLLIKAYNALDEARLNTAKENNLVNEFNNAKNASVQFYRFRDNPTTKIVTKLQQEPSRLLKATIKPEELERTSETMSQIPEADRKVVRRAMLDEMLRQSENNPKKFLSNYNRFTPEVKKAFFGEDQRLVDSISGVIDDIEKQKTIVSKKPVTKQQILSQSGAELDKIMEGNPSELADEILKRRSPELARTVNGALGKEGTELLNRAMIQKLLTKQSYKTAYGDKLKSVEEFATDIEKWDPSFIRTQFGKDANLILGIRDSAKQFKELADQARIGRSAPSKTLYIAQWAKGLFTRWRITPKIEKMLRTQYGEKVANEIINYSKSKSMVDFTLPGSRTMMKAKRSFPIPVAPMVRQNEE